MSRVVTGCLSAMSSGRFSEEQERTIGRLVRKSVTVSSGKGYDRQWRRWVEFLETVEEPQRPHLYLQDVGSEEDRAKWVVLFIADLMERHGVRGSKAVGNILAGLKFQWKEKGLTCEFLDSEVVKQAKNGTRLTTSEIRRAAERDEETRLIPVFVEMLIAMRSQLWDQSGYDRVGLDMKAQYVAAAISFDSGLRPGQVTLADGPDAEDHCLRARDFVFLVDLEGAQQRLRGGEEIRMFLLGEYVARLRQVLSVDFVVMTGKNQNRKSFARTAKTIGRGSIFEELLLEDLCEWMVVSGVLASDEFVARYAPGAGTRKVVTSKELRTAVKAVSTRLGFPPERFSSKCLRSGFATHMVSCGISREDMLARAGWSLKSRVPDTHYISSFSRGAYGTAYDPTGGVAGLGIGGAWKMLAPGSVLVQR